MIEMPRFCSISIQSLVGGPTSRPRLDRTRLADGARVQQELLGQRRLAGVRVADDGERAAPSRLVRGHQVEAIDA